MKKLLDLQKRVGAISKEQTNPFFKSKYFDINALIDNLKPILNELGLVIVQPLQVQDGRTLLTTLVIDTESGEQIGGSIALPDNLEPQKMGSAITYYRRYSLQSLLLLQAEDDDGNKTKPPTPEESKKSGLAKLRKATNMDELGAIWLKMTADEKMYCIQEKEELKKKYANN